VQKGIRHLYEDAGAVSRIGLTAAGAAMVEVKEDRQRLADDLVGFFPFDIYHEADTTGIMFELRIVESLFFWWSDVFHVTTFESSFQIRITRFWSGCKDV